MNKELNWYQSVISKKFQHWNKFDEIFPEIGDKVELRFIFLIKSIGVEKIFIGDTFKWKIDKKDKEQWLNIGLCDCEWRISKKPDDNDIKRMLRKKKLNKILNR